MISSMNSALLILRQGDATRHSYNSEISRIAGTKDLQASVQQVFFAATATVAELSTGDDAAVENSATEPPHIMSSEYGTVINLGRNPTPYMEAENYGRLAEAVGQPSKVTSDLKFQSKVVEATTLSEPASEKWQRALEDADRRTGLMVGALAEANVEFHKLNHLVPTNPNADASVVSEVNMWIDAVNRRGEDWSRFLSLDPHLKFSNASGLRDNVTLSDSGEYKLSAYQIKTDDGKLVAEMKDNGHYVTYNEDGSIRREMDRSDVTSELASKTSKFSRLASLLYSDDKDMQFY